MAFANISGHRGFTGAGNRTLFAGFIPGTANVVGAAAHLFGHVEGQLSVTRLVVGVKVPVAIALPHVCQGEKKGRLTQSRRCSTVEAAAA